MILCSGEMWGGRPHFSVVKDNIYYLIQYNEKQKK